MSQCERKSFSPFSLLLFPPKVKNLKKERFNLYAGFLLPSAERVSKVPNLIFRRN
jgi:hypothetical protein